MKRLYAYESYRQYLRDFYVFRKKAQPSYTYARFAQDADLGSPNYLKLVIDGTRGLTVHNIHQFARALGLQFDELDYFEALVLRDQAEGKSEREYYSHRLRTIRRRKPRDARKISKVEFVSRWYIPALIFALQREPESTDLGVIARKIGISTSELKEALVQLRQAKVLRVVDHKYTCDASHLVFSDPRRLGLSQKRYLQAQLQKSLEAFDQKYDRGAKFQSHTFTLPEANFALYQRKLAALAEELIAHADQGPSEKVAQLNVQFFTLEK